MLISDFGLCKKLDTDESSFQQTVNHAAGSFGYRAPEVLRGQVDPNEQLPAGGTTPSSSTHGRSASSSSFSGNGNGSTDPTMRLTRSIDIFSLGCIFYYVLTGGEHPFGGRYEREMNILRGEVELSSLDGLGEEAGEGQDLIRGMVESDPRDRYVVFSLRVFVVQRSILADFVALFRSRSQTISRNRPSPSILLVPIKTTSLPL